MKTGGGSNPIKEDALCLQVKGILGSAIEPMDNAYDDDAPEGNFEKESEGNIETEWEDVVLDVEESRGIPEEDVGLQGNEDSVQFTIENVPEPSNEKVATFSVEPDFQNIRNYFSFCLITMFYFIADNE